MAHLKFVQALPLLVIWGIWLERNDYIFLEKYCMPVVTATLSCGILIAFPQHIRATKQRETLAVEIDWTTPWGVFDGESQNNLCGGGALIVLSDSHYFELTLGLGEGSNNYVELLSLKLLLIFIAEEGCQRINIFGDSLNVINWIKGTQHCRQLRIENILLSVREAQNTFDTFLCCHVYMENNKESDKALMEGFQLDLGIWKVKEFQDGTTYEYYHWSFIE